MYKHLPRPINPWRKSDYSTASGAVIALLMVAAGILVTIAFTTAAINQHARSMQENRQRQSARLSGYIERQLADYEQLLLATAGAMHIDNGVSGMNRDEWRQFITSLQVSTRYPEIIGVGYATHFSAAQLGQHIDAVRAEGFSDYTVTPADTRDDYTAIQYLEPLTATNQRILGYDMFTEPILRQAMSLARDTAQPAITAPVDFGQSSPDSLANQGILMYYPVYATAATPNTVEERRQLLSGYTCIAFRVPDIMAKADMQFSDGTYTLRDISDSTPQALFVKQVGEKHTAQQPTHTQQISALNRSWQSELYLADSSVNKLVNPLLIFSLGVVISCLIGGGVYILLSRRMRTVHRRHQRELQRTKDELLALTSHQLRTPATGVKQYLGMLMQGYFGQLDTEQSGVVHKAYAANERQLEIIDQLLYVAKADAGQILLVPERFDIAVIAHEIVDGFYSAASTKSITLQLKTPKSLSCTGDPRYVRMVIENLVSNAIKYSYEHATVRIRVTAKAATVRVSVTDSGVGIKPRDLSKLFQKFGRIDNPLSRTEGGSGLGLFLAQKLARAHHGSIEVKSRLEQGSTFTFILPKRQPHGKNVAQLTD